MSDHATHAVWNNRHVKGSDKLLLLAIANVADHEGVAWPSVPYLVEKTGLTRQGLYVARDRLVKLDELRLEANTTGRRPPKARMTPRSFYRVVCVTDGGAKKRAPIVKSFDKQPENELSKDLTGVSKDLTESVKRFDVHTKDRSTYGSTTEELRVSDADAPETENPGDDGTPDAGGEPPAPPLTPDTVHALWNDGPARSGCAASQVLTPTIRRDLERLIREHPDWLWWEAIFDRVIASPYLTGELDGTRARLGWLVDHRRDALVKLEEGQYDARVRKERGATRQPSRHGGGVQCPHEPRCRTFAECFERIRAERRSEYEAKALDGNAVGMGS